MPRSTLPSLAVLSSGLVRKLPLLLDADGLELDERVEFSGLQPTGVVYRVLRDIESQAVRRAAAIIVRTSETTEILLARAGPCASRDKFSIVTNGRDSEIFQPFGEAMRHEVRRKLGIDPNAPVIVYAGSAGRRYRMDALGQFALNAKKLHSQTRLLVLSGSPDIAGQELFESSPELRSMTAIMRVPGDQVPQYLAAADVGTAMIKAGFSTSGIAPVKTGEYLLCGVPVVGTAAVGSNEAAMKCGVFFDDGAGLNEAARWFVDTVLPQRQNWREAARKVGVAEFSLERSIDDYRAAIDRVTRLIDRDNQRKRRSGTPASKSASRA